MLPFITTFNPTTPNRKKILMKRWHLSSYMKDCIIVK